MYKSVIRPILFALSKEDAEKAHELAVRASKKIQRSDFLLELIALICHARSNNKPYTMCGITFPNRVGVAAGVDKNGEMLRLLQAFGPGFLTVGSVLPYAQSGNPRPRIFRLPEEQALINRLGFNGQGSLRVHANLAAAKPHLTVPISLSLGKMKDTPLEHASRDYIQTMGELWGLAEMFVLCISSPNTPGLRELQKERYLRKFIQDVVTAETYFARQRDQTSKPIFVKWTPDVEDDDIEQMLADCKEGGASGLVISNTTLSRPLRGYNDFTMEAGGLSGDPVFQLMWRLLYKVRRLDSTFPIIAVGGITDGIKARWVIDAGANLVKSNTGLIYRGPTLIREAKAALAV